MDKELIKKGNQILDDIEELKKLHKLLNNKKHKDSVNIIIYQHYGSSSYEDERVEIPQKFNKRLFSLVFDFIDELEEELEKL